LPAWQEGDGVDVARSQEFAQVDVGLHVAEARLGLVEHGGVDIAQRDDANTLHLAEALQVVLAAAVQADDRDADTVVGAGDLSPGAGGKGRTGGGEGG
jgi:hypothetical protein